jgi:methionine sulfoxide reductase heme-binding subunit
VSTSTHIGPHLFWLLSRGAGTTALVLSSISVCVGLVMAGRLTPGHAADRRTYHEILSLSVIVAIAVHGLVLVGDGLLHPSLVDVTVPLAWRYMQWATTLGIVAGWALICLGLSFYARDHIGRARWKLIHRFTLLAWVGGIVHTIVEGTDAGTVWYIALLVVTTAPVLILLAIRVVRSPEDFGLTEAPPARAPSRTGDAITQLGQAAPVDLYRSRSPAPSIGDADQPGPPTDLQRANDKHLWAS